MNVPQWGGTFFSHLRLHLIVRVFKKEREGLRIPFPIYKLKKRPLATVILEMSSGVIHKPSALCNPRSKLNNQLKHPVEVDISLDHSD